jgi:hypothetical protein
MTVVNGINGNTVYGYYEDASSQLGPLLFRGFTYEIPEPAGLSLLILGGLIFRRFKNYS